MTDRLTDAELDELDFDLQEVGQGGCASLDAVVAICLVREVRELRKTVEEGAFARKVYSAVLARDASALNAALTETYGAIRTPITQEDMAWADDVLKSRQYPLQSTQPVEGGWRPIETAPKDGSAFLAFGTHDHSPGDAQRGVEAGDYWWAITLFDVWREPSQFVFAKDGKPTWSPPTHWQPLPPPPAQEEE